MLRYLTFAHCIPVRASNRSSFGLHPGPNGHTQIPPFGGLATPHPCGDNSSVGARSLSMLALTATAVLSIGALAESGSSPDPAYAPLAAALVVAALLTARARPGSALTPFVVVPALVAYARFGAAGLPSVACASLVANLVHGVRGPALAVVVALDAGAFAAAYLLAARLSPG